jgi:anti-sigma regulatory factor (Ser/Thr protein kinase)
MDGRKVMTNHKTGITHDLTDRRASPGQAGGFSHTALLYRDAQEYRSGLAEFVRAAARSGSPLQAVLPWNTRAAVGGILSGPPARAQLVDMAEVGRNPARLIAAGQSFIDDHRDQRVYCVWEPAWPGRTRAELREVTRHEALCNLAFSGQPMTMLCPYDVSRLGPEQIADAMRTHPLVISGGRSGPSPAYLGDGCLPSRCDDPLPSPARGVESLGFTDRLGPVREFSARHAEAAGLSSDRARDLILAVSEIAANSLSHAGGGVIRAWRCDREMICQIEDLGHIRDPLAGRRKRPPDALGGHGLWLVNRVCDLVERRTSRAGTMTRLHMRAV